MHVELQVSSYVVHEVPAQLPLSMLHGSRHCAAIEMEKCH